VAPPAVRTADPGAGTERRGTLFVVATPIGNLGDVTLRALETLRTVPLIAAEDTRIAARLLARHGIATRRVSFHAQSGPARLGQLLEHLRQGADLAVVTDAGTPGVSDPGEELVSAWAGEGGRVVPIPGPSAVIAAVAASAIAGPRWTFEGFLPRSGRERRERMARIAGDDHGAVIFEAPTRLLGTMRDLAATCGTNRAAAICRELTKLHEQIARGTLGELLEALRRGDIPRRGEAVIVLGPSMTTALSREERQVALADGRAQVDALVAGGLNRSEAARRVASMTGLSRRLLYHEESPAEAPIE
jgi:16S rRNA (cytidine1402-2'-O)-methyltransferase